MKKSLDIVIPVYNESECIEETMKRLDIVSEELCKKFDTRVIYVDDGSKDDTFFKMDQKLRGNAKYKILKLTRNFGHQLALTAGLDFANADFVAILDGDLQDPPELLHDMLLKFEEGYHVVYGQRNSREGESFFKLVSASLFYKILSRFCDVPIPRNTGDFRIITRQVLISLNSMRERHRFIRGLVPFTGWKSYAFPYERKARFAGETKYPMKKMFRFAFDAILSFSTKPIKIMRYFGLLSVASSFMFLVYVLYLRFIMLSVIPGFTVIIALIIFFGGIQVLFMSLLGEYIGRIFEEVKARPLYFIQEIVNEK
jgi:polyisoprenyl-phosphate glycosyltransferase